jgi:serine/threonine protein phosphatase PrpC
VKCGVKKATNEIAIEEGTSNLHRIEIALDEELSLVSDIGHRHINNEDCGIVARTSSGDAILIVADGVSTSYHPAGASSTAVKILSEALTGIDEQACVEVVMRNAIQAAHEAIITQPGGDNPDLDGPLTTIVAALVQNQRVTIGWVGDSRAYVIGDSDEVQLTVDDSWMEQVVATGEFTREEAAKNCLAHAVTQVLGTRDEGDVLDIHVLTAEISVGKILLLCTDGLWNYFEESGTLSAEIRAFGTNRPAIEMSSHLAALANIQGGQDNITVAVLTVGKVEA